MGACIKRAEPCIDRTGSLWHGEIEEIIYLQTVPSSRESSLCHLTAPLRSTPSSTNLMSALERSGSSSAPNAALMGSKPTSSSVTDPTAIKGEPDDKGRGSALNKELQITSSLEDLQTDEQRRVLDTVADVRKCGLDSILSLPQLVVCGDQSAGKSSVLEALTEIPFPRNDNLCTRYATEIILRRAMVNSLTIKIIPDALRPAVEQSALQNFKESITDLDELPRIMDVAKGAMDAHTSPTAGSKPKAFSRDILSIEIEGPSRPQLTLVDIPGLIQTDTKGVTKDDIQLVSQITDQYISRSRTICLAVVSASNDYSNQKILTKVRDVDPDGQRTIGIITKPDIPPAGSGSEAAFLELARNEDVKFSLGWHVLKNREYKQRDFTLQQRKDAEDTFFRTTNWKTLPDHCRGIDALRTRLSHLLFEHVKEELPKLREDLENALMTATYQLHTLGDPRSKPSECKAYLSQLSLDYFQTCKAAVDGHYEGEYFISNADEAFDLASSPTIRRMRAVVQHMNAQFAENMRINGHRYQVDMSGQATTPPRLTSMSAWLGKSSLSKPTSPQTLKRDEALEWARSVQVRTRGRELVGNFNPLLVGELFWEQSSNWQGLARQYLESVEEICNRFLKILLEDKCPKDIVSRLRQSLVQDTLKVRYDSALEELGRIVEDNKSYPINYNHYYTETINERRQKRQKAFLAQAIEDATTHEKVDVRLPNLTSASVDVNRAVEAYSKSIDPDMEKFGCEEALDCVFAIYEVRYPLLHLISS